MLSSMYVKRFIVINDACDQISFGREFADSSLRGPINYADAMFVFF